MDLIQLNVEKDIKPNPYQPREIFDDEKLEELADNIKAHGLIEPIVVCKKNDKYMIVAGERRWRASKKAGIKDIYALVKQYNNEADIKRDSLVENEIRENLSNKEFKEFAESLAKSLGEPYWTKGKLNAYELTKYVYGTSSSKIENSAFLKRLRRISDVYEKGTHKLKQALTTGKISLSTAALIASVADKNVQEELLKLAQEEDFDKLSKAIKRHNIRQEYEKALTDKKISDEKIKKEMSKPQLLLKLLKRINEWTMDIGGINELLKEDNRFMFKFTHEEQLQILDSMKPLRRETEKLIDLMSKSMERISDGKT